MTPAELYPLATATLRRLLQRESEGSPLVGFRLGPAVLRAPPPLRRAVARRASDVDDEEPTGEIGDLLGELVDLVLVGADDADSRHPEVHLQFKGDVFGGVHLRLVKAPEGIAATFTVGDVAARRAVEDALPALLQRLKERGFPIVRHQVEVA